MVTFVCDDRRAEQLLEKLARQVVDTGGWLDPEMQIRCEDGNLSILSDRQADSADTLIALPEATLLPVERGEFYLSGDDLCFRPSGSGLSRERSRLLDTMLEIYNVTGKIARHRATSPWLVLAGAPQILRGLVAGRADAPVPKKFLDLFESGAFDPLTIECFVKTRVLGFKDATGRNPEPVIMPVIDFINHHPRSPGFQIGSGRAAAGQIAVLHSTPVDGSRECFVRYGLYDAYDTYLMYSYVNEIAPFVRSVPLTIDLKGLGAITVRSVIGVRPRDKIPDHLADLRGLMPVVRKLADRRLSVSHLIIPSGVPKFALRRILAELIRSLGPSLSNDAIQRHLATAEMAVLSTNIRFYENLVRSLDNDGHTSSTASATAVVRQLAELQLSKIHDYIAAINEQDR